MVAREEYMKVVREFIDKPLIKVITGMRRCGKSALLEMIKDELVFRGVDTQNIIYVNFESLQFDTLKSYKALYSWVKEKADAMSSRIYILLDEVQEVTEWEKAVNSFRVDFDCDVYVTGSNARLLASEFATLIAGRYVEIKVYPLSFKEYLDFAKTNLDEINFSQSENFANYLRFGGMPGIHQLNWNDSSIMQYLTDIYNSVLIKDVLIRNKIENQALLSDVIHFLMDNIGNTFSAKTISNFLKSQSRQLSEETIYNYLKILESAFLVHKVKRFDIKGKHLLETQEKYYLSDLGLRHAVMGYRDNDIGGILENVVYLELLRRGYTVNIGKMNVAEVDFVAQKRDDRLYAQVCYVLTAADTQREFAPLEAIADNYEKIVLSTDSLISFNRNGIKQKNIEKFLLEN